MGSMQVTYRPIKLTKRYPLRIARGVSAETVNLFVKAEEGGLWGMGEMAPGALTGCETAEMGEEILRTFVESLPEPFPPVVEVHARARAAGVAPCALAALDTALWDLLARRCGVALHVLLGLARRSVPTSVTIGIEPAAVIRERVPEILERTGARFLKVKLGSPDGIEADKEHYEAAREASRERKERQIGLRVDANGGWSLAGARAMMHWLAARDAAYVEQPLHHERMEELPALAAGRPLPIFLDESCRFASDIPAWAGLIDGVNLKLMKCGGITEALRIVATARAHGLQTMIGCMGESSVAISAGASLGALFDHVDLDSHLNLLNDPARGAELTDGVLLPPGAPGHGARLKAEEGPA